MKKEPFFIRHGLAVGIIIFFLILISVFALMAVRGERQRREDSMKENMDLSTLQEVGSGGIYDSTGVLKGKSALEEERMVSLVAVDETDYKLAKEFISAYEEMDSAKLSEMLTDGVVFDYDAYFTGIREDFPSPVVIIKGFYEYSTDTVCACQVCGKMSAENGELVFDYENSFLINFSVLDDGSVMPYRSGGNIATDPYLALGMTGRGDVRE